MSLVMGYVKGKDQVVRGTYSVLNIGLAEVFGGEYISGQSTDDISKSIMLVGPGMGTSFDLSLGYLVIR